MNYHEDYDHVSCSMLKVFCKSPVEYYHTYETRDMPTKKPTKYMDLGKAVHAVLLDEKPIHEAVKIYPDSCLNKNDGLIGVNAAKFRADYPADMYVKDDTEFRALIQSIQSSPIGKLIEACPHRETEHRWLDESDLWCRIKPDAYGIVSDIVKVYDFKITEQIEPKHFERNAKRFMTWLQESHYSAGLHDKHNLPIDFNFIAIEPVFPFRVALRYWVKESKETANKYRAKKLEELAMCKATGRWTDSWVNEMVLTQWDVEDVDSLDWEGVEE